jgi:hypothetical protein
MEEAQRPLTSAELIRQAREDLAKPTMREEAMTAQRAEEELLIEQEEEREEVFPIARPTAQPRQRPSRARSLPPDPFASQRRTRTRSQNPRAAAAVIGVALLVMGIAIAAVLFAATATP